MKEKMLGVLALGSAFLASLCCTGPIILAALGLGGAGLAASFGLFRPVLLLLTLFFLIPAFYFAYHTKKVVCADGSCEWKSGGRGMKITVWIVAALALGAAAFPQWAQLLQSSPSVSAAGAEKVVLAVSGMHCSACPLSIESSLRKVPGVRSASVSFEKSEAVVLAEPGKVSREDLLKAVRDAGPYAAELRKQEARP